MVKHQQFVLSSSTCLIHGVGQKVPRDFEVALGLVPIVSVWLEHGGRPPHYVIFPFTSQLFL